jgi:hypothetical protein
MQIRPQGYKCSTEDLGDTGKKAMTPGALE